MISTRWHFRSRFSLHSRCDCRPGLHTSRRTIQILFLRPSDRTHLYSPAIRNNYNSQRMQSREKIEHTQLHTFTNIHAHSDSRSIGIARQLVHHRADPGRVENLADDRYSTQEIHRNREKATVTNAVNNRWITREETHNRIWNNHKPEQQEKPVRFEYHADHRIAQQHDGDAAEKGYRGFHLVLLEEEPERSLDADHTGQAADEQNLERTENGISYTANNHLHSHSRCRWPAGPCRTATERPGTGMICRNRRGRRRSLWKHRTKNISIGTCPCGMHVGGVLLCVSVMLNMAVEWGWSLPGRVWWRPK